jgi:hypothetical protein
MIAPGVPAADAPCATMDDLGKDAFEYFVWDALPRAALLSPYLLWLLVC